MLLTRTGPGTLTTPPEFLMELKAASGARNVPAVPLLLQVCSVLRNEDIYVPSYEVAKLVIM
jgi:hypothetical protein